MVFMAGRKQDELVQDLMETTRKKSQLQDVGRRLFRNKLGMLGFGIIIILLIMSIFPSLFTSYDHTFQDFAARFNFPSKEHIMGCDQYGRDLFARLIYGGRVSLLVSVIAVTISGSVGIFLGCIAGYFGGKIDLVITRFLDILMAIPHLLMCIAVSAALGNGPVNTAFAISISGIPGTMRIMRSTVLSIKSNEFVEAAIATGSGHLRALFKHVLPNSIAPLIVNLTLQIGTNIMAISGLSFIGLGVQPPTPEWGSILAMGRPYIREFWPLIAFPALFIMLTVFGFNLFGDGLRDSLDPRLKD
jgi:peptide/nickel transport system permease protein